MSANVLVMFTINFSWISMAFFNSIFGFLCYIREPKIPAWSDKLSERTAVIMPIYNEDTHQVFARMEAIYESVAATGFGDAFDFFILSDTTHPVIQRAELRALCAVRLKLGQDHRFYYRRRKDNCYHKAGNISDFVKRWGNMYASMVVLDADSLMTGDCIVSLAFAMETDPDAGIIQTLPYMVRNNTLLSRAYQFAARIYSPVIAMGNSTRSWCDGNYWGHNAIIRIAAYTECAGLPIMSGRPPFGGNILSHDFVEAALIRRGGWSVYMLPDLLGSYEESPPSLIDLAIRDHRWCQGNLQHMRIINARGFKLVSRQHFFSGIMSYLTAPFWLIQLIIGFFLLLQTVMGSVLASYGLKPFAEIPGFDAARAVSLFALTAGILLFPKLLGYLFALIDDEVRRGCGGVLKLTVSLILEILVSTLYAPITMLSQTEAVVKILLGKDAGWRIQRRSGSTVPITQLARQYMKHMMCGIAIGIIALIIHLTIIFWMIPTILSLTLAIPISWMSGNKEIGNWCVRKGLLITPEDRNPPEIITRMEELSTQWDAYLQGSVMRFS